jgi:hypothetical protein
MNLVDIKVGESYTFSHVQGAQPDEVVKVVALPNEEDVAQTFTNSILFGDEDVIEIVDPQGRPGLVFATELSPLE